MHYSPSRRGLQPRTGKRARLQSAPTGFLLCLSPPVGAVCKPRTRERARLQSAPTGFSPRLSPQHTGKRTRLQSTPTEFGPRPC